MNYESLFNLDDNERNNEIERMIEFEGRFVLKYLVQSPRITVEYRLALTDLLSNLIKFQSKELYSIIVGTCHLTRINCNYIKQFKV